MYDKCHKFLNISCTPICFFKSNRVISKVSRSNSRWVKKNLCLKSPKFSKGLKLHVKGMGSRLLNNQLSSLASYPCIGRLWYQDGRSHGSDPILDPKVLPEVFPDWKRRSKSHTQLSKLGSNTTHYWSFHRWGPHRGTNLGVCFLWVTLRIILISLKMAVWSLKWFSYLEYVCAWATMFRPRIRATKVSWSENSGVEGENVWNPLLLGDFFLFWHIWPQN